ncbi:MAG: hypothetical protein HC868_08560, partial [Sphingomonadales bacterium]|nr:hypothetical protein [Sphingomonadales bacterium]
MLRDELAKFPDEVMDGAIRQLTSQEDGDDQLRDRLATLVVRLPNATATQARELLGARASTYAPQVDRVIN